MDKQLYVVIEDMDSDVIILGVFDTQDDARLYARVMGENNYADISIEPAPYNPQIDEGDTDD